MTTRPVPPRRWRGGLAVPRAILLSVATLAAAPPLHAKEVRFRGEHISVDQGLSQAVVNDILEDGRGFLWFATNDGLNRYDSYGFDVFRQDPADPESLVHNGVLSLLESRSGTIWIGTRSGLNRLDPESYRMERVALDARSASGEDRQVAVTCLFEDRRGTLWIGTSGGLQVLDAGGERTKPFALVEPGAPSPFPGAPVSALEEDHEGRLWVGTDGGGVFVVDPERRSALVRAYAVSEPGSLSGKRVSAILVDALGKVWVGTLGNGLSRYDERSDGFLRYRHDPDDVESLPSDDVTTLAFDPSGCVWVGTAEAGFGRLDPESGRFDAYRPDTEANASGTRDRVLRIHVGASGLVWVGTRGAGVTLLDAAGQSFEHIGRFPGRADSLSDSYVYAIHEDPTGGLWVGTARGLNLLDREQGTARYFFHDPDDGGSLSQDNVRSLLVDRHGDLWIGTAGGGLDRLDRESWTFEHFRHDPRRSDSLANDDLRFLHEDRRGRLWIGTAGGGLNLFDPARETFRAFRHREDDPDSLSGDEVRAVYEDEEGRLFLGVEGHGLDIFDPSTGKARHFRADASSATALSYDEVRSICADREGFIWVGTRGGGLNRLDLGTGRFRRFTEEVGFPSDVVYAILPDDAGNLWISTDAGIVMWEPHAERSHRFGLQRGLQSLEFNHGAFFRSESGELFFGGVNGVNAFRPERVGHVHDDPPVVLASYTTVGDVVRETISGGPRPEILLSPGEWGVSLDLAGLDYRARRTQRYRYALEGGRRAWSELGSGRSLVLTGLSPGDYAFRVQTTNAEGHWSRSELALTVRVLPSFWETGWARALAVGGLAVLLIVVYRARMTMVRRRSRLLQSMNERLEAKMREQERTSSELRTRVRQIEALNRIIAASGDARDRDALLRDVVDATVDALPLAGGYFYSSRDGGEAARLEYCTGADGVFVRIGTTLDGAARAVLCGEGRARLVEPGDVARLGVAAWKRARTSIALPIHSGGASPDVLLLACRRSWRVTPQELEALDSIGRQLASAIQRVKADEAVRRSLAEKVALLQEIHHRVKNNLQIVSSMHELQSRRVTDEGARAALRDAQSRVRTMALAHESLYLEGDLSQVNLSAYFSRLAHLTWESHGSATTVGLKLQLEDVLAPAQRAISVGLVLNELLSNALKHAFPAGGPGQVSVRLRRGEGGMFLLEVEDDGPGLPAELDVGAVTTLGLALVRNLVDQLDGTLTVESESGVRVRVRFDAECERAEAEAPSAPPVTASGRGVG